MIAKYCRLRTCGKEDGSFCQSEAKYAMGAFAPVPIDPDSERPDSAVDEEERLAQVGYCEREAVWYVLLGSGLREWCWGGRC